MTDIFTKEKRRSVMSSIKSANTKLEQKAFLLLKEAGIRFRKFPKGIIGRPDAANKSMKLAIFIDSRFWHGYEWKINKSAFRSEQRFWIEKIERNIRRDKKVNRLLRAEGWTVIRLWEQELSASAKPNTLLILRRKWKAVLEKKSAASKETLTEP